MDLYFKRHDGQAVTCEDFFAAMRDANDADFANFLLWYVTNPLFICAPWLSFLIGLLGLRLLVCGLILKSKECLVGMCLI